MSKSKNFSFDGGAGTFLGTAIVAFLITSLSLGLAFPWAVVLKQQWIAKHTTINGKRCKFIGSGAGLFGLWIKWFFLLIITIGIYGFWIAPELQKWIVEHTEFEGEM